MGIQSSYYEDVNEKINIATLNFCGYSRSPFEYFNFGSDQELHYQLQKKLNQNLDNSTHYQEKQKVSKAGIKKKSKIIIYYINVQKKKQQQILKINSRYLQSNLSISMIKQQEIIISPLQEEEQLDESIFEKSGRFLQGNDMLKSQNPLFYSSNMSQRHEKNQRNKDCLVIDLDQVSKYDKNTKDRMSPLYNSKCCIQNGKFLTIQEFQVRWFNHFLKIQNLTLPQLEQAIQYLKVTSKSCINYKKFQKNSENSCKEADFKSITAIYAKYHNLYLFDEMIYRNIMKTVYHECSRIEDIFEKKSILRYLNFMEYFFTMPHINQQLKASYLIQYIKKYDIDVMFLQQTQDEVLYKEIQKRTREYRIIRGFQPMNKGEFKQTDVAILVRYSKFPQRFDISKSNYIFKEIAEQVAYEKQIDLSKNLAINLVTKTLNLYRNPQPQSQNQIPQHQQNKRYFMQWGKCAILSIDKFIFICVHLGLRGDITDQYMTGILMDMERDIKLIKQRFPKKFIVIGGMLDNGQSVFKENFEKNLYLKQNYEIYSGFDRNQVSQNIIKKTDHHIKESKEYTSRARRTKMQTQWNKLETTRQTPSLLIYDKAIHYNRPETESSRPQGVFNILGKPYRQKELIPNKEHPFHHYILQKTVKFNRRIYQSPKYKGQSSDDDDDFGEITIKKHKTQKLKSHFTYREDETRKNSQKVQLNENQVSSFGKVNEIQQDYSPKKKGLDRSAQEIDLK